MAHCAFDTHAKGVALTTEGKDFVGHHQTFIRVQHRAGSFISDAISSVPQNMNDASRANSWISELLLANLSTSAAFKRRVSRSWPPLINSR